MTMEAAISQWPCTEGELAARIRSYDWAATPLGPISNWSAVLRAHVSTILALPTPAKVMWGAEAVQIHNDAYEEMVVARAPACFARPLAESPPYIPELDTLLASVRTSGVPVTIDRLPYRLRAGEHASERWLAFTIAPLRDERGIVAGLIELAAECATAQTATAEADALAKLNDLSLRLWSAPTLEDGLNAMLASVIESLGADKGKIRLLDDDARVLKIAVQRGFEDVLDAIREVPAHDDSACGRALRTGARIVIEDIEADVQYESLHPTARRAGYRALISTPLIGADGTALGMISIHWRSAHRPTETELARLSSYVLHASHFIQRRRMEQVLRQREAALRRADRRKDEFLATLAHELRNPLAAIRSGIHIARRANPEDPLLRRTVEMMDRQLARIAHLVEDLLDVERISSGKIQVRFERVALAEVLANSVETSRADIDSHGHEMLIESVAEELFVAGDFDRLTQVFSNLLSNAAKYTEPGGHIRLCVRREGSEAVVQVIDSGLGIPAEDLPHIFELFSQVRAHRGRAEGGMGIGLSLVRKLVAIHGGTVSAASPGLGHGAIFTVRLPLA